MTRQDSSRNLIKRGTVLADVKVQCSQSSPCSPHRGGCAWLRASLDGHSAWRSLNLQAGTEQRRSNRTEKRVQRIDAGNRTMIHEIAQVWIDETSYLYVKPSAGSFAFINRASPEVNWSPGQLALFGPKPREWSYARWFQQIVSAVKQEYGVNLVLAPSTEWRGIPDGLRHEIKELQESSA